MELLERKGKKKKGGEERNLLGYLLLSDRIQTRPTTQIVPSVRRVLYQCCSEPGGSLASGTFGTMQPDQIDRPPKVMVLRMLYHRLSSIANSASLK